jgi:hypothetical protein
MHIISIGLRFAFNGASLYIFYVLFAEVMTHISAIKAGKTVFDVR